MDGFWGAGKPRSLHRSPLLAARRISAKTLLVTGGGVRPKSEVTWAYSLPRPDWKINLNAPSNNGFVTVDASREDLIYGMGPPSLRKDFDLHVTGESRRLDDIAAMRYVDHAISHHPSIVK